MLVVSLLNELVRSPSADLDRAIAAALRRLGEYAGADRAYIFVLRDPGLMDNTQEWCAPGVAPMQDSLQGLPVSLIARWRDDFAQDRPVHIPDVAALPADAPEKSSLRMQGIRALLAAPMLEDGRLFGFIGFDRTRATGVFSDDQLGVLTGAADVVQGALLRQQAEARLRATSRQLEATLAALPDLLFEIDASGCYSGFVAGPRDLMAAPPELLKGHRLEAMLPPDVGAIARRAFDQVIATGRVGGVRYALDLPQGRRWFELSGARKEPDAAGQQPSAIFLVREVTADTALREELSRLGKIVETMSNLVAVVDPERRIVWVNAAFERQTGWRLDEIRGKVLGDLVRCAASDPAVSARLAEALARREPFHGETLNQDRHGNRYWIDFNMLPLWAPDGALQGFVSVETVITTQKQQETALAAMADRATAARLRLERALDALPDGAIVLDADERIVVANKAYYKMFPALADVAVEGAHVGDVLRAGVDRGLFLSDASPQARDHWVADRLRDYRETDSEKEMQLPDGRWINRINRRTADGGCIALGFDVTARHNHMAALDAANTQLRRALHDRANTEARMMGIIEAALVGTWEWELGTGVTRVGGHWLAMLGYEDHTSDIVPIEMFRSLVHPDDMRMLDANRAADLARDTNFIEREFRMRHKNGHWVWILSRSRVTERGPDGEAIAIGGVNLDVSNQKRLQRAVEMGGAFLEQVMQTSIAALVVFDAEGGLVYCNPEAERVLHLTRAEAESRAFNDPAWYLERVEGGPLPDAETPFRRALASGVPVRDALFALRWPDGTRRILSCNAARLMSDDGDLRVVESFTDVTEQLAINRSLDEARQRAEDASRAKSVFLANMSHEIRTPLNGVLGMTEVLESSLKEPEHKRIVGIIRTSGETLLMVLNSILDMSKIEAGKMVLDAVAFKPSTVVRHTEAVFAVQAEEKGLEFDVLISAGSDRSLLGDPHRIQQILNNLLHNAIKFTEKGAVSLKLSCKPGKPMVIEVTDTGIGMAEAQVARVFESFEQADGSTTRRFGGTGLGLSIVKELVALMGGEMALESAPGRGTKVRVSLPLPDARETEPARPRLAAPAPGASVLIGRRLLIADDNATNRLVLCEMLAGTGVQITTAENGQLAIEAWQAAQAAGQGFDLLLLDITMPVLDGLSALGTIREAERAAGLAAVPAVAVTANAMPHQVADYILGGFDSHLAKPFKHQELMHAIRTLIGR
ncbi:PAS domain-containing protein [Fertoebacter nigrum]|uniref:histidine kinase n=1 Tax=Fertoeibacter niger TaxID=2656921 RepID=A0A8X8H5E1_9RHOB|nr:PAS domain-containing protein [Fertoeibacter niger]NUB43321.1 PAS domain-containing protein [Fertoeibacter niger]